MSSILWVQVEVGIRPVKRINIYRINKGDFIEDFNVDYSTYILMVLKYIKWM